MYVALSNKKIALIHNNQTFYAFARPVYYFNTDLNYSYFNPIVYCVMYTLQVNCPPNQ